MDRRAGSATYLELVNEWSEDSDGRLHPGDGGDRSQSDLFKKIKKLNHQPEIGEKATKA